MKWNGAACTIIMWRRTLTRVWVLWTFQFHTMLAIYRLAEELFVGKEGLGS